MANHHGRKKRLRELRERLDGLKEQAEELAGETAILEAEVAQEAPEEASDEAAEEQPEDQVITPDANSVGSKLKFWS